MAVKKDPKKNLRVILLVASLVIALVVIVGISSFASVGTKCEGPTKEKRKTTGNHGNTKLPKHAYEEYRTRTCLSDKKTNQGGYEQGSAINSSAGTTASNTLNGSTGTPASNTDTFKILPIKYYWSAWSPWQVVSHKEPPALPVIPKKN